MKKIILLSLLALFICSIAGAESIPNFYDYTRNSFTWYATIYNNTNKTISSNTVVTLDMRRSSGTMEGFAAYASQEMCTGYVAVLGIADEDIASKTLGRICVRGPHQAKTAVAAGATVGTNRYPRPGDFVINAGTQFSQLNGTGSAKSSLGGVVKASTAGGGLTTYPQGFLGYRISVNSYPATNTAEDLIWIWVNPTVGFAKDSTTAHYGD